MRKKGRGPRKRREGRGGGERRIRGASRFSAGLRASQWLCTDLRGPLERLSTPVRSKVSFYGVWSPFYGDLDRAHCSARRILCIRFIPPNVFVTLSARSRSTLEWTDLRKEPHRDGSFFDFLMCNIYIYVYMFTFDIWCSVISSILLYM